MKIKHSIVKLWPKCSETQIHKLNMPRERKSDKLPAKTSLWVPKLWKTEKPILQSVALLIFDAVLFYARYHLPLWEASPCFVLFQTCRYLPQWCLGATLAMLPSNIRNVKGHQGLKHWTHPWPSIEEAMTTTDINA